MRRESLQLQAESELQRKRLALARAAEARLESLRAENFVSSAQVQAKAEDVLGVQAQLQALERQQAAQRREIDALEAQWRELPLRERAQQGEIERDLSLLAQQAAESEAQEPHRRARAAGRHRHRADRRAGPERDAAAPRWRAWCRPTRGCRRSSIAPSSAVGFVRPEQTVLLRYQAYPVPEVRPPRAATCCRCRARRCSRASSPACRCPARRGAALGSNGEPLYRITVALDEQAVAAYGAGAAARRRACSSRPTCCSSGGA